jgi:hypothetical protein
LSEEVQIVLKEIAKVCWKKNEPTKNALAQKIRIIEHLLFFEELFWFYILLTEKKICAITFHDVL